jgi:rfaE bifunctional protein kinase chain/domain
LGNLRYVSAFPRIVSMKTERFHAITGRYLQLSVAVVGDFCLDRYLEIDPAKSEVSIETGLPVHNVVSVRAQPGGAGTVLNNLAALGVGKIFPVGFAGDDGEGFELCRALAAQPGARLDHFIQTAERHTFTYCKPLMLEPGKPPRELNRLDQKNWSPTPKTVVERLRASVVSLADSVDAFAILSQVDQPDTGVLTPPLLDTFREIAAKKPPCVMVADSRHSLRGFPPVMFKMNAAELAALTNTNAASALPEVAAAAGALARRNGRPVFVTLAERGILGASPDGQTDHVPAIPMRGEIDIVGAGDAVMANLTAALAAGAELREAMALANAAASVVIHQLGTTGTATLSQLQVIVCGEAECRANV